VSVRDIVTAVYAKYPNGGAGYYNLLDDLFRTPGVFQAVAKSVDTHFPGATIVASGQFGNAFERWCRYAQPRRRVIVVRGGLRYSVEVQLDRSRLFGSRRLVFVDDTMYKGRTRAAIEGALNRAGYPLDGTVVAYASEGLVDDKTFALFVAPGGLV
jgi:hypothetical protein